MTKKLTFGLAAIMRDEGRYILEWLAYHRTIGFDQITIYDNQSTDETADTCRALARSGELTYIPWPDVEGAPTGPQLPAYQHAAQHMTVDWLCCLDADEFLVLERAQNLNDLVIAAGGPRMPMALCWRNFGSAGELTYSDRLVTERFTLGSTLDHPTNIHLKMLGPTSALRQGAAIHYHGWLITPEQYYVDGIGNRVPFNNHAMAEQPYHRGAWINHYAVKSRAEFEEKVRRGDAAAAVGSPTKYNHRSYETFFIPHDTNDVEDRTIHRFLPAVRDEMARLKKVIERESWWLSLQDLAPPAPTVGAGEPGRGARSFLQFLFGWIWRQQ